MTDRITKHEYTNSNSFRVVEYKNEDGKLHNIPDKPARITYHKMEGIFSKEYFNNGLLHRENGPAVIWYDYKGNISEKEFFKYGNDYTEEYEEWRLKLKNVIGEKNVKR